MGVRAKAAGMQTTDSDRITPEDSQHSQQQAATTGI